MIKFIAQIKSAAYRGSFGHCYVQNFVVQEGVFGVGIREYVNERVGLCILEAQLNATQAHLRAIATPVNLDLVQMLQQHVWLTGVENRSNDWKEICHGLILSEFIGDVCIRRDGRGVSPSAG